jgi:hypothetical protein
MQVHRNGIAKTRVSDLSIHLSDNEAGALASVLAGVVDNSSDEAMDRLYNLLLDRGVIHTHTVEAKVNEMYDEEDPLDPFTHNLVVTD